MPRTGQASASPTVPASSTPLASPTASASAATPSTLVPPSPTATGAYRCRLPVWGEAFALQANQARGYSGGLIGIPGGSFTLAQETVSNVPPEQVSGWTYSQSLSRWLPVRRQAVSPDGIDYAWIEYASTNQRVHVIDGSSKVDRVLVGSGDFDRPVWQSDGLYAVHHLIGTDSSHGLARIDITTGKVIEIPVPQLTGAHGDWTVASQAAWATDWTPGNPPMFGLNNRVQRYDLATGQLTTWYYSASQNVSLYSFTPTGLPIVEVDDISDTQFSSAVVAILDKPNSIARSIAVPGLSTNATLGLDVMPDAGGLWLLHFNGGVWWVPSNGPAEKVSSAAPGVLGIGGPCLAGA